MSMKKYWILLVLVIMSLTTHSQIKPEETEIWEPEPTLVTSGGIEKPPSDAIILFDGTDFDAWQAVESKGNISWNLVDGKMEVAPNTGNIETKQDFGDIQLHIEWLAPVSDEKITGQDRSNSGVFLQSRYEVQILDSYQNRTYSNGQAGAIYKQHAPLVNAMNKSGDWQVYEIIFTAPKFDVGKLVSPGYLTVLHNGILIQNHVEIKGSTVWQGYPSYESHGKAPIRLQDHDSPILFRNIWVREL